MTDEELQTPLSEIELAHFIDFCQRRSLVGAVEWLRRLAFQRDALLKEVELSKTEIAEVNAFFQER